jgi:hypothetical protein
VTFTYLGGSTKVQTWFLSKFSNSSCMALTQLKSESVCTKSRGSKRATKAYLKSRRDELTSRNVSPFHSDYLCSAEVEMISPSTCDASTAAVEEEVSLGASALSVEAGTGSGDDVGGSSGSSSSPLMPYSPSSTKMLSSISLSPAPSKISQGQGAVSLKVTSHDSTTVLVSKL